MAGRAGRGGAMTPDRPSRGQLAPIHERFWVVGDDVIRRHGARCLRATAPARDPATRRPAEEVGAPVDPANIRKIVGPAGPGRPVLLDRIVPPGQRPVLRQLPSPAAPPGWVGLEKRSRNSGCPESPCHATQPVSRPSEGSIVGRPEVSFLDEPTAGFDPQARRELHELVHRLTDLEGTTVLLTTHDLSEAEKLADRILILASGRIVADGSPDALARRIRASAEARWSTPRASASPVARP